jgi:hypothetical protein
VGIYNDFFLLMYIKTKKYFSVEELFLLLCKNFIHKKEEVRKKAYLKIGYWNIIIKLI